MVFARPAIVTLALLAGGVPAQVGIQVEPPGGVLEIPLPPGQNRILDAVVTGDAKAVWLALHESAVERVALRHAGDGRYQVNLADPAVEALLLAVPADRRASPTFVVCAESVGGEVVSSVAVRYRVVRRGAGPPELHLVPAKGTPAIVPMTGVWGRRWVTVSDVERLAIATGERPLQVLPVASTGSHTWAFAPEGRRICVLPVAPDVRKAWREGGFLQVEFEPGTRDIRKVVLQARPEELDLPADPSELTVVQRKKGHVPGSRGYLRLSIGDVTGGQVLIEMVDAEGGIVLPQQSMRQGDEARFVLGEREYVLSLPRLVNFLIGDDYAVFTVGTRSDDTERRIRAVLDAMVASELTFVRNGTEYDGAAAAEFIRGKYALRKDPARSFAEFVEDVASRSSTTGRPYLVRSADGTDGPLSRWLVERDQSSEQARRAQARQDRNRPK